MKTLQEAKWFIKYQAIKLSLASQKEYIAYLEKEVALWKEKALNFHKHQQNK